LARGLAARVVEQFGQLDVVVNSAAVMHHVAFEDTTPALYDEVMALNLRSIFFVSQGAAPFLRKAGGKIVNMADLSGLEPWPGYAAHSLSKAGVVMLTKVLARSLAPEVTVNAIAPGAVLVPDDYDAKERARLAESTPLGRLGTAEDAVQAMLYLLERADFVTGDVIVVDGGRLLR
jgi:pteridine reductase